MSKLSGRWLQEAMVELANACGARGLKVRVAVEVEGGDGSKVEREVEKTVRL